MINEDSISKVAKALGVEQVTPEIYKDLLQPAFQETGNNLLLVAKSVSIALTPLSMTVWGYDKLREWVSVKLTHKLAEKEPEEICNPKLNIAAPIITNLPYVFDEVALREMYINLLASSMVKSTVSKVHPSFAFMIQQLSSDEALLLSYISSIDDFFIELDDSEKDRYPHMTLPAQVNDLAKKASVSNVDNAVLYFENLTRLNIFKEQIFVSSEFEEGIVDKYDKLPDSVHTTNYKLITLSDYGRSFIDVCV